MDFSAIVTFTLLFGGLLFLLQRTEAKKRLIVLLVLAVPGILLRNLIVYRDINTEGLIAFILAVVINFAFYLFIGRYNPVGSSDRIQVIGMDD